MASDTFVEGPIMQVNATFNDTSGNLIDYTVVKCFHSIDRPGAYPTLTYAPGGSGTGVIIKSSTGLYYVQFVTLDLAGTWNVGWQGIDGAGNIQAQASTVISVVTDGSGLF